MAAAAAARFGRAAAVRNGDGRRLGFGTGRGGELYRRRGRGVGYEWAYVTLLLRASGQTRLLWPK
jgi:hypothetical protein